MVFELPGAFKSCLFTSLPLMFLWGKGVDFVEKFCVRISIFWGSLPSLFLSLPLKHNIRFSCG